MNNLNNNANAVKSAKTNISVTKMTLNYNFFLIRVIMFVLFMYDIRNWHIRLIHSQLALKEDKMPSQKKAKKNNHHLPRVVQAYISNTYELNASRVILSAKQQGYLGKMARLAFRRLSQSLDSCYKSKICLVFEIKKPQQFLRHIQGKHWLIGVVFDILIDADSGRQFVCVRQVSDCIQPSGDLKCLVVENGKPCVTFKRLVEITIFEKFFIVANRETRTEQYNTHSILTIINTESSGFVGDPLNEELYVFCFCHEYKINDTTHALQCPCRGNASFKYYDKTQYIHHSGDYGTNNWNFIVPVNVLN